MRKLAGVLLLAAGCFPPPFVPVHVHGAVNPVAAVATGLAVGAVAVALTTRPPMTVEVGYAGDYRPGYVWVNGCHRWNGNAYVWVDGYYQPEQAGYYWVQ